jgi:hypothetical protein
MCGMRIIDGIVEGAGRNRGGGGQDMTSSGTWLAELIGRESTT